MCDVCKDGRKIFYIIKRKGKFLCRLCKRDLTDKKNMNGLCFINTERKFLEKALDENFETIKLTMKNGAAFHITKHYYEKMKQAEMKEEGIPEKRYICLNFSSACIGKTNKDVMLCRVADRKVGICPTEEKHGNEENEDGNVLH